MDGPLTNQQVWWVEIIETYEKSLKTLKSLSKVSLDNNDCQISTLLYSSFAHFAKQTMKIVSAKVFRNMMNDMQLCIIISLTDVR